ncbi:hypothetical protein Dimus_011143 [Dionaea muscipula]
MRPPIRKLHLGVLSKRRLRRPSKKMIWRYAVVLLGSSSRRGRMALDTLSREHILALVMRNVAELSAITGHSIRRSLGIDTVRKRYRREMRAMKAEVKEEVILITKDKQIVEEENKRLKADLEKEKAKGKRSRERLVLLLNDLSDESLQNERLHTALNETTQSLIKIMENRHLVEAHLPKQLEHLVKEAQRKYLESDEFIEMFNRASAPILRNGWRMGIAQVRRMLDDDDPIISELDKLKQDVNVPFTQEKIEKIEKKPAEWTKAYDARVLESIEEWGKEIEEMFPMPPTYETSNVRFLEEELEKIRAIMISYAILEDTSTSTSDKQDEDPSPIVVEDPMFAIVVYGPPSTFEEEDRESVGEFEMSTSEDVDSLFDD